MDLFEKIKVFLTSSDYNLDKNLTTYELEKLHELTKDRIYGTHITPLGSLRAEEDSEDVVIKLLQQLPTEGLARKAVINGLHEVFVSIAAIKPNEFTKPSLIEVTNKYCRIIDHSAPEESKNEVKALMNLFLNEEVPSKVRGAIARANLAYHPTKVDTPIWLNVTNQKDIAAYGISALINIDPYDSILPSILATLWEKEVVDDWEIDTAFFVRRLANKKNDRSVIKDVLQKLKTTSNWFLIEESLKQRYWTNDWLGSQYNNRAVTKGLIQRSRTTSDRSSSDQRLTEVINALRCQIQILSGVPETTELLLYSHLISYHELKTERVSDTLVKHSQATRPRSEGTILQELVPNGL